MKNTLFSPVLAVIALLVIAAATVSMPKEAAAQSYSAYHYGGGYNYNYYPTTYYRPYIPPNPYPYVYPPAPSSYNTPTVQYTYANGYYQNYFVPTVRYYPPVYTPPVYTPPVYNPPYYGHPPYYRQPQRPSCPTTQGYCY